MIPELTPVEYKDGVYLKRDDLYSFGGAHGAKARSCVAFLTGLPIGLTTATSRQSVQIGVVARIGKFLGLPVRCHTPSGRITPEMQDAVDHGAELVQHVAGYTSVVCARAKADAARLNYTYIPYGMEHYAAIESTRLQVQSIALMPERPRRIVVSVGFGMTAVGILRGLRDFGLKIPVVAVQVGADPTKRFNEYFPGWQQWLTAVSSSVVYETPLQNVRVGGVLLDPHYEAKCAEFLQPGDLLWVAGIRPHVGE